MQEVKLSSYGRSSTTCYTDAAIVPGRNVLLLSLAGNDSSVKACAAIILEKGRSWEGLYLEDGSFVSRNSSAHYHCITNKLAPGQIHMVIADRRFWEPSKERPDERLLLLRPGEDPADVLYDEILNMVPSPTLPAWKTWLFEKLSDDDRVSVHAGYGVSAMAVKVDEEILDEIISAGVKAGEIGW